MLKTISSPSLSNVVVPPAEYTTIRPVRSVGVWLLGSLFIGAGAGTVFGLLLAVLLDGAPLAAAAFGLVYGVMLAWPFGLLVGGSMAALRVPRTEVHHIGLARRNGLVVMAIAGLLAGGLWPVLLFAAAFGALVAWPAVPTMVRLSARPAHRPIRETQSGNRTLSPMKHESATNRDGSPMP